MNYSSHRLRAQERNVIKKLIFSLAILFGGILFAVFIGLPILARLAVSLSLIKKENTNVTDKISVSLFAPIIEPLPLATNSASIAIYGSSDKERTITLWVNGEKTDEKLTDEEGKFNFRGVKLKEGNNKIEARTKFKEEESAPSQVEIVYKKEPPKLEIQEPSEGQNMIGEAKITIKGQTDPDTRISINDRFVIVERDGNFSYPITLKEGENSFSFTAIDEAGNVTQKELKVNYSP